MSKYQLPEKIKKLLMISYVLIFLYLILLPFLVYYIYQSVNLAIESSLNTFNGVFTGEIDSGERKIVNKTLLVSISENFFTSIAGGLLQIVTFALIRFRRPYRHISYKLAFYLSPIVVLFSVLKIILSFNIQNFMIFSFMAFMAVIIFIKLLDKDVKLWSAELLPPPPNLSK